MFQFLWLRRWLLNFASSKPHQTETLGRLIPFPTSEARADGTEAARGGQEKARERAGNMAVKIPLVLTQDPDLKLYQTQLAKALTPITQNPINFGTALTEITLTSGSVTTVPTTLDRPLQGWFLTRVRSQATIWETVTQTTDKTLALNTSATVVVDLWVF